MKRLFLKTLAAAVALAACGLAAAQDKTFKIALQNPKGHPLATGAEKFAELVSAKSGGKLKVNVFPGGTLGSDQANVSAVQGGTHPQTAVARGAAFLGAMPSLLR